jgi:hypothetical protein
VAAGNLPNIGWVIPDLSHDAHDGTLAEADNWLAGRLPAILSGPDFRSGNLAVVITADEDDNDSGNKALTVVVGPGLSLSPSPPQSAGMAARRYPASRRSARSSAKKAFSRS